MRVELVAELSEFERRMVLAMDRSIEGYSLQLAGLSRALGDPTEIIDNRSQQLDYLDQRLEKAINLILKDLSVNIGSFSTRLVSPDFQIMRKSDVLDSLIKRHENAGKVVIENAEFRKSTIASRLKINAVRQIIDNLKIGLERLCVKQDEIIDRLLLDKEKTISGLDRLLEASSLSLIHI